MDNTLVQRCGQSLYEELYHPAHEGQSIVLEKSSGRVFLKKTRKIYSLPVFEYLQRHPSPHIPAIRAYWEDADGLTVIEEYIQGETLAEKLSRGELDSRQKKKVLLDLCDALEVLHSAAPPIIHRDVKPSNIMITDDGITKLIDYDAARVFLSGETQDTQLMGTQGNAAPEQYGFAQSDARTDIYAVGVLMRQMFPDRKCWQRAAKKATQMDPKRRYRSVRELRSAIRGLPPDPSGIPGFRTRTPWKEQLAVFGYLGIFYFSLTLKVTPPVSAVGIWASRICLLAALLELTGLFCGQPSPLWRNPLLHAPKTGLRILGYLLSAALVLLFYAFLAAVVNQCSLLLAGG